MLGSGAGSAVQVHPHPHSARPHTPLPGRWRALAEVQAQLVRGSTRTLCPRALNWTGLSYRGGGSTRAACLGGLDIVCFGEV